MLGEDVVDGESLPCVLGGFGSYFSWDGGKVLMVVIVAGSSAGIVGSGGT